MLEGKLESSQQENVQLMDELQKCRVSKNNLEKESFNFKAENSKLMANLNSTKAQLHFEESKAKSMIELEKAEKIKIGEAAK